ncbi:MAG: hypothetical protein LDLANPLL_00086 [Turneriella sp.]|nr:hypothetical protein [Turneriella sp.]
MGVSKKILAFAAILAPQICFADARFVSMHGKVQVFENGRWVKATLSSRLTTESSVQVGYRSGAVAAIKDGSQVAIKENSVISFNSLATDGKSPRSEIFVVQGGVSAFVKKPEVAAKNRFYVRTPTVVVGVRGSFFELAKNGEQHFVTAVESPAFIKASVTETTTRERLQKAFAVLERAYLIDRDEARRLESRIRDTKNTQDTEILRAVSNPTFERDDMKAAIKNINDHKTLVHELIERQKQVYAAGNDTKASAHAMLRVRALTMLQLAWAEMAYKAELNAYLIAQKQSDKKEDKDEDDETFLNTIGLTVVPQGDSARAADEIRGPLYQRTFDSRAERNFGAGITSAEQHFLGVNTDSQAGFGNDVQGLYNSINAVTQPSETGEPTLRKF